MRQMINMEIDSPARRVKPESLSSHLICIGQNVSLSGADRTLLIQSILLSPTGQVAFRLKTTLIRYASRRTASSTSWLLAGSFHLATGIGLLETLNPA